MLIPSTLSLFLFPHCVILPLVSLIILSSLLCPTSLISLKSLNFTPLTLFPHFPNVFQRHSTQFYFQLTSLPMVLCILPNYTKNTNCIIRTQVFPLVMRYTWFMQRCIQALMIDNRVNNHQKLDIHEWQHVREKILQFVCSVWKQAHLTHSPILNGQCLYGQCPLRTITSNLNRVKPRVTEPINVD